MGKLKLSENLFLEVAELERFRNFMEDNGWKRAFKHLVQGYGIVQNDENSYFKVTAVTGSSTTVTINAGIAYDSNMDAIVLEEDLQVNIANTGSNRWIILSRDVTNYESGTVNISTDGTLSGTGTSFTEVLRGAPNFPTKVKFNSTNNTAEYEVVSVTSDTEALLTGDFTAESGIQYSVVGTFTPGWQPDDEDKQIYEYDSYAISVIDSDDRPTVGDDEFILAMVSFDTAGGMTVTDERIYNMFDSTYTASTSIDSENSLTSLVSAEVVGGTAGVRETSLELELILEHGYTVTDYVFSTTSSSNVFTITSGSCNFVGSAPADIPDNIFAGWLLVNRANMISAEITSNTGATLYIGSMDSSLVLSSGNDFVVVPNFAEVEYQVQVSSNVTSPDVPFYFRNSIDNVFTRAIIHIPYPTYTDSVLDSGMAESVTVSMKYRLKDTAGTLYAFNNLAVAQFINVDGETETLGDSSFTISIADMKPEAVQRNYS